MKLKRLSGEKPNFRELDGMVEAMEDLLEGRSTGLTLEGLYDFQDGDGSFALLDSHKISNEAIIDFINIPTYIGTSILMKDYLKGNREIKENLERALSFTFSTGLRGHGYEDERTRIKSLKIFIKGGLLDFLEKERDICPRFHHMIHNILHMYRSNLYHGNTFGPWGEDYRKDWEEISESLKVRKRLYLAYGSNISIKQMSERCPGARLVGRTYLNNWELTLPFFANIERKAGEKTPIVVWEISSKDEINLDHYEGYPKCYDKKELLININNRLTTAMAYIMTDEYKNQDKVARHGYVEGILEGYLEAGFDKSEFKIK